MVSAAVEDGLLFFLWSPLTGTIDEVKSVALDLQSTQHKVLD